MSVFSESDDDDFMSFLDNLPAEEVNKHLFDLEIVRYDKYIQILLPERYDTLFIMVSSDLEYILNCLEKESSKSIVKKTQIPEETVVLDCIEIVRSTKKTFNEVKKCCFQTAVLNNDNVEFSTKSHFFSKYRGLLLACLHSLYEVKVMLKNVVKKSYNIFTRNSRRNTLSNVFEELERYNILFGLVLVMEKELAEKIGYNYCCDGITEDKVEELVGGLDYSFSYRKVGLQIIEQARVFYKIFIGMNAAGYDVFSKITRNKYMERLLFVPLGLLYSVMPKTRARKNIEFAKKRELYDEKGLSVLTLLEDPLFLSRYFEVTAVPIKHSKVFHVKVQEDCKYTKKMDENIKESLKQKKYDTFRHLYDDIRKRNEKMVLGNDGEISMDDYNFFLKSILQYKLIDDTIPLRVICPFDIPVINNKNYGLKTDHKVIFNVKKMVTQPFMGKEINSKSNGTLVFHVHGGGWVFTNTHTHECYTRRYSKELSCPVISVEYTNSPERRYPHQIMQIWNAYKFVIENAEEILGCPLRRLFITGDSAGANMCFSVLYLAISSNVRLPDAAFFCYPTLVATFSICPSRIMALIDPFLSKSFLILCSKLYPFEDYPAKYHDPFISPLFVPDEILQKFPPLFLSGCSCDPLFDDVVCISKRLTKLGVHNKLKIIDFLPHSYLNFHDLIPDVKDEIKVICRWFKKLCRYYYKDI